MKRLYRPLNVASVTAHYAATGIAAAATLAIASPWAIGAAVIILGGISALVVKEQKKMMEDGLVVHPISHEHSPRLGEMVRDLYEKSGMPIGKYQIYDFRADSKNIDNRKGLRKALSEVFNTMANVPNAAAFNLGKPIIMISEPLLKLLDDDEEKAVLAHEFVHATAKHQHVALPQRLLTGVMAVSNGLTLLATAIGAGIVAFGASIVSAVVAGRAVQKLHKDGDLLAEKKDYLSIPQLVRRKEAETVKNITGSLASVGVMTYFMPAYLPLYAAIRGLALGGKVLNGTLSRSMEYQADRGAVERFEANPLALITSLRKITEISERSKLAAANGEPIPQKSLLTRTWAGLTASHPTLERRIERLSELALAQGFSEAAIHEARTKTFDLSGADNIPRRVIEQMARRL